MTTRTGGRLDPGLGREREAPVSDSEKEEGSQNRLDASTVQLVLKETKDLIRSLEGTDTRRVKVQAGALQIEVDRRPGALPRVAAGPGVPAAASAGAPAEAPAAAGLIPIVAPLVGVFYRAPSPGAQPFVEVGDTVERGQKVGIVEAMKLMNEVTSDYRGVVSEILVENGETVQYEQRLMLIDTTGKRPA
jgi:acetyl-CoA carboxylase biotin carboxyl carrier protein